jgi:long-chain acyl-CoA synthetase
MERIWLKSYPPGVPHDIDPHQFSSLVAMAEDALQRHAERTAYVLMDHGITYREVDQLSATFAAWLQRHGLQKGDRIALMLPNVLQYPVAMLGALRAGLVVVNTNPLYTADELRHQLNDSGAAAIVVLENFCHVLQQVISDTQLRLPSAVSSSSVTPWPLTDTLNVFFSPTLEKDSVSGETWTANVVGASTFAV